MTQEAHKLIIVWQLSYLSNAKPERKEYSKETAHFYVRADGRREAKTARYYQFFATQEAAQAACDNRAAAKQEAAERERRQIACVNALAGLPIEAIESGVFAELVEAARGLKTDLLERAEWDGGVRVVCAGAGAWARFCNALAKLPVDFLAKHGMVSSKWQSAPPPTRDRRE